MKTVARIAIKHGMTIAQDVYNYRNELLFPANTKIDDKVLSKLARHEITAVSVMEDIDFAETHFEKIQLSKEFQIFEREYERCLAVYKQKMTALVEENRQIDCQSLLDLYIQMSGLASSGAVLLDYLYNMVPNEDELTHTHCLNSALIAGVYADWLSMSQEDKNLLILCAFFYDIGKLKLPYEILWKTGKLSDVEFARIKTHPMIGFDMIKDMQMNPHIYKAVLMHHERCDGQGYPSKLRAEQINPFAKHIAIIDAYEAMTSPRAYRNSLTPVEVIAKFEEEFNRYDQAILRPFLKRIADTQIGLNVKLNNDSQWEIFIINPLQLSRPILRKNEKEFLNLSEKPHLKIISIY